MQIATQRTWFVLASIVLVVVAILVAASVSGMKRGGVTAEADITAIEAIEVLK